MNKNELIRFEEEIAEEFNAGKIRAPVHLAYGNEDELIHIFRDIRSEDWVFCSWRSHYQCLLKGVPPELLRERIRQGKSIALCFPEHRIFSSAIVTGVLPIALGVALTIKREERSEKVYCFVGDMTSETGAFEECLKYAQNFELPLKFIIEDNGRSICTDTKKVWNMAKLTREGRSDHEVHYYKYESRWPHAGAGKRVQF